MTDFENKDQQVPQEQTTPPQEAPQSEPQAAPAAQPEPAAPAPEAPQAPAENPVPHLTLDPNEADPFQGDPFRTPEPPRAPEPPQPEPAYQQAPHYGQPPQYEQPQYGAPQYYQPPQYTQPPQPTYYPPQYNVPPAGYAQKSRLAAGLLAILLGTLGIHNFYLGFTTRGVIQLLVSVIGGIFTCGIATVAIAVWAFVEGVLLLSASPSRMYDGHGVILRD